MFRLWLASMTVQKNIKKTIVVMLLIIATSLGLFVNKMLQVPTLTKEQLKEKAVFLFEQPRLVKDFDLLNHKGEKISKADLTGKWSLVFFGFTYCPDICPATLAVLNQMLKEVDAEVKQELQVVLVSVDPARDTPEILGKYINYFNPEFIGITGDFLKILSLTGNLNAAFKKVIVGDSYTVDHSANIFLLNPRGDYVGFFKPPFQPAELAIKVEQTYQSLNQ